MLHKLATITGALLLLTGLQAATVPEEVVHVQTTIGKISNGQVQADMSIRNNSTKTITDLEWVVEGKYSDGSIETRGPHAVDLVNELMPVYKGQTFVPGSTRSFQESLPAHGNDLPVASTRLLMVVFDDDTAVGDFQEVQKFAAGRRSQAASIKAELDEIKQAMEAPSPKEAAHKALKEHHQGQGQSIIMYQVLMMVEDGAPRADIETMLAVHTTYYTTMMAHSKLEVK
jgi:hypothetical protein